MRFNLGWVLSRLCGGRKTDLVVSILKKKYDGNDVAYLLIKHLVLN